MTPSDDLRRLRDVWDRIPPPSEEQRQRARSRLLAAIPTTTPGRRGVTAPGPTPVQPAGPLLLRPDVRTGGTRRRLVAAVALAALLLAVLGISWQALRALRSDPPPVIDEGEPDIPTSPLPLRTEPDVELTGEPPGPSGAIGIRTYVPDVSGPWPVVVLVPGIIQSGGAEVPRPTPYHEFVAPVATAIAERGAVVHLVLGMDYAFSPDAIRDTIARTACALRYVRATAPDHGALDDRLVLVGHEIGAWSAALVALMDPADLPTGPCTFSGELARPTAFVGFAGGYDCDTVRHGHAAQSVINSCALDPEAMGDLIPVEQAELRPDVPFRLVGSSIAPESDEAFGAALRDAGHPVQVQLVDGASPGDFLIPGTPAHEATIAHVLELARG